MRGRILHLQQLSAAKTITGYERDYLYHFFEHNEAGFIPSHIDLKSSAHQLALYGEFNKIRNTEHQGVFVIKKNHSTMDKFAKVLTDAFNSVTSLEDYPIMILDDESDDQTCPISLGQHKLLSRR